MKNYADILLGLALLGVVALWSLAFCMLDNSKKDDKLTGGKSPVVKY